MGYRGISFEILVKQYLRVGNFMGAKHETASSGEYNCPKKG
jgi:hypothetical protein